MSNVPHLPVPGVLAEKRIAASPHRPQALASKHAEERKADDPSVIDLRAYWLVLLKRRFQILGVALAIVAAALIMTLVTPSIYRATAILQIDSEQMQIMQVQGITPVQGGYDMDYYNTQYELLKSRALAERVAEDMNLAGSDIFQRLQTPPLSQRLRQMLRLGTPSPAVAAGKNGAQSSSNTQASDLRDAAGLVLGGLLITPVRNTHLVRINYDSAIPSFSAKVANAVADGFIASSLDRQLGASSYAKKYLEDQLAQLTSRLEDSERALVELAQKEKIVPTATGSSLVGQNLLDLNASLAKAQDQRIRAESRWNQAKAAGDGALPADMLNNDTVLRGLQDNLGKIQADYQDKLQTFKADYPTMLALKGQIDAVKDQIKVALANIRASVRAEYDAAAAQEKMLVAELSSLRTQALEVDSRSIQYNILKRDADTNRQLYAALLQRYKEVGMAGGVKASNLSIVDRAEVPTGRFAPSLSRNLEAGAMIGLMLGVMLALVLEHLDDTLKTPEDVEKHLHLAVLGIIPRLSKQTPDAALKDPRSSFSESYRSLRTALQFSTDRGVPKILLITSPAANEGKSTTALTLARNFAQLGKRVLLIEGDLRRPSLAKTMGISAGTGLSNLLAGAATAAQATMKTNDERIDIMVSGPPPPSPTELLAGPKLVSLLLTSAEKYDQVIIDGPPVLGIADAPILANASTGTLLVIRSRVTKIASAQSAMRRLKTTRARLIGALLAQHEARTGGYGYYYYDTQATYGNTPRLDVK